MIHTGINFETKKNNSQLKKSELTFLYGSICFDQKKDFSSRLQEILKDIKTVYSTILPGNKIDIRRETTLLQSI